MIRLCNECGGAKPKIEFRKHKFSDDRLGSKCKECRRVRPIPSMDISDAWPKKTYSRHPLHVDGFLNMRNRPSKTGYIYFAKPSDGRAILVRHTYDVKSDLEQMQAWNCEDIILLLALPGCVEDLDLINQAFSSLHYHDNWYCSADKIVGWITKTKQKKHPTIKKDLYTTLRY